MKEINTSHNTLKEVFKRMHEMMMSIDALRVFRNFCFSPRSPSSLQLPQSMSNGWCLSIIAVKPMILKFFA